jgi:hypothetical protein
LATEEGIAMISHLNFSSFLDRIVQNLKLTPKKLLKWYSYVLIFVPLACAALVGLHLVTSATTFSNLLKNQAGLAVGVIIALCDLIIGYFCLLNLEIFYKRKTYRVFMVTQVITQALVGNFMCVIMAILGIYLSQELPNEKQINLKAKLVINLGTALLLLSFVLLVIIEFKK